MPPFLKGGGGIFLRKRILANTRRDDLKHLKSDRHEPPVGLSPGNSPADDGGYREVLRIAVPLVLSTASLTLMLFVNRMFLAWHGQSSVAAATPGGITYFTICSFFLGTAEYVNALVAQYHGAGDRPACSRSVWQGVWFSLASAPVILALIPAGRELLAWSHHGPELEELEKDYFSLLMFAGVALPFNGALSSFFSGRGKTRVVLWGNLMANGLNMVLDYVLIFGKLGFPEMGIRGAGLATAITSVVPVIYWGALFLSSPYQREYRSRRECRWDPGLFRILVRYGFPAGGQLFLDVASFTVFVLLVGRLGEGALAASNVVLTIDMLSFLPMVGMSIATAALVGKYMGRNEPEIAEKSARSALKLGLAYSFVFAALFWSVPELFLHLFSPEHDGVTSLPEVVRTGAILLRMVAIYTLFDTMVIVLSGALKGAGDTTFALVAQTIVAWVVLVAPVYVTVEYLHMDVLAAWSCLVCYSMVAGTVFLLRFRSGYWKTIRLIQRPPDAGT